MITLDNVGFRYRDVQIVQNLSATINNGEIVLLKGATGSGKSTLLGLISGQSPTFTGGHLQGSISIDDTFQSTTTLHEWARLVGCVQQSPRNGFVGGSVEDEIVFGMENFGYAQREMRHRLEELIDSFALQELRYKSVHSLSAGQQQLVAIAAAVAVKPRVLLLDEPTSALDADSTLRVLAIVKTLAREEGLSVLVAEHRIERLTGYIDRELELAPLNIETSSHPFVNMGDANATILDVPQGHVAEVEKASVSFEGLDILRNFSMSVVGGRCAAVIGENGAGKTTLLQLLTGDLACDCGSVRVCGLNPADLTATSLATSLTVVPQQPSDVFLFDSVQKECALNDRVHNLSAGSTFALLQTLTQHVSDAQHPRELSEGQQLLLALALAFAGGAKVVLLDEPTRGLDVRSKTLLAELINLQTSHGRSIIIATHDIEFANAVAQDVFHLEPNMRGAR